MPELDAILIPGGGVREGSHLPVWTRRRLDRALEVHQGEFIVLLSAGTLHKPPPLRPDGFPIFESVAAADYLVSHGLDPRKIFVETCSYDTIGNAFFSRVIHIDPQGLKKLLIITSEFHMPRTREIFEWVYGLPGPHEGYALTFEAVSDDGIDPSILTARIERERDSLQHVLDLKTRLRTLKQLHEWLFTRHAAYSAQSKPIRLTGNLLDTY